MLCIRFAFLILACLLNISLLYAQSTDQITSSPQNTPVKTQIQQLLRQVPLIDGHNDLPWQVRSRAQGQLKVLSLHESTQTLDPPMHTDLSRLKAGGLGAQFWSVYVPASLTPSEAVQATLEQIDVVQRLVQKYPQDFAMAYTADDVTRIHQEGKIASLLGMEGGYSIGHSLAVLRQMYHLGARYMTLTHSKTHLWADSATDAPQHDGLSEFGEKVILEMNRLGMMIDLSHVAPTVMTDALRISKAPMIFSHSGVSAICNHPRNVPDHVLDRLVKTDGVVMVIFLPAYLKCELADYYANRRGEEARLRSLYPHQPKRVDELLHLWQEKQQIPQVNVEDVLKHIDYIRHRIGAQYIGLGGDFDGMGPGPVGLEDVGQYPRLIQALLDRGYSSDEVKGIMGLNVLRVMRKVEAVAQEMKNVKADETPALHFVKTH